MRCASNGPDVVCTDLGAANHYDLEHLKKYVSKKATVLLPEFPTTELEDALRECGFTSFVAPASGEVIDLDGLQLMIHTLVSPTDGPIGIAWSRS